MSRKRNVFKRKNFFPLLEEEPTYTPISSDIRFEITEREIRDNFFALLAREDAMPAQEYSRKLREIMDVSMDNVLEEQALNACV